MNMKKIFAILMAALLACTLMSCKKDDDKVTDDDEKKQSDELVFESFTYGVSGEGTYEITGYLYGGTELVDVEVPATIDGREVTGIAADAFKAMKTVKSVKIPDTVLYIGQYAFYDCDAITAIDIPDSVTSIGTGAFQNCGKLASVKLPTSLGAIAPFTFKDCTALKSITLPTTLVNIGDAAFWGCTSLKSVTLPEGLKDMGDAAFYSCTKLADVTYAGTVLGETEEDAEGNKTEHEIGEIVFHSCSPELTIATQKDTAFAKWAEDNDYKLIFGE